MPTTITVGKARLFSVSTLALGNLDLAAPVTVGASNGAVIRATMNPTNNRQFAVVALAPGQTNANVTCNGITAHALVTVPAPPPVDTVTIDEAGVGPEIDPPSWA